jgi:type II secretory pathway component PulF
MALLITPRKLNQHAELYHQLGIMLAAGLSVHQCLQHLLQQPPSNDLREPISKWLAQLNEGHTVSQSLRATGDWIPSFDIALIDAAEMSGRLDACFKLLSKYYQERAQTARQMISDSAYPLFVFNFAIVLFPLIDLFSSGNFTRFFWMTVGVAVPLYALVFAIIFACQGRHGEAWRSQVENFLGRIPVLGRARRELALARLATALESLLNAGVPIVGAWELAATASGSPALARAVRAWKPSLEAGSSVSDVITKSGEFPQLFANLYHTGEISGTIDDTLLRLNTLYQTEGAARIKRLAMWTPKIVYFGIMLFVAWKIIAYYTGYFQQVNQAIDFK